MATVSPPIGRLPVEALFTIFKLASPPLPPITGSSYNLSRCEIEDQYYPVLVLAAVCSHFRKVVLSSPSLFTSFRWSSSLSAKQSHNLFLLFLEAAQDQPIHLYLSFTPQDWETRHGELFHPLVDPILIRRMPRIKTLVLQRPPFLWFSHLNSLTSVVDFKFDREGIPVPYDHEFFQGHLDSATFYVNKCTSLRRLHIENSESPGKFKFHYRVPRSLPALHLSSIPVDSAFKLVSRCINLVELQLDSLLKPHNNSAVQSWFGQSIIYPRLETLTWSRSSAEDPGNWSDAFLTQAQMPALTSLEVFDRVDGTPEATAAEISFLGRVTETLHSLHIKSTMYLRRGGYDQFFSPRSSIQNLTLSDCYFDTFKEAFKLLTPEAAGDTSKPMPGLRSLTVAGCLTYDYVDDIDDLITLNVELGPDQLELLALMLERRLASGDRFRLEFEGNSPVEWTHGVQEKLRGLVRQGIQLEVYEDGDSVDWLRD